MGSVTRICTFARRELVDLWRAFRCSSTPPDGSLRLSVALVFLLAGGSGLLLERGTHMPVLPFAQQTHSELGSGLCVRSVPLDCARPPVVLLSALCALEPTFLPPRDTGQARA